MLGWLNKLLSLAKYGRIPEIGDRKFKDDFLKFAHEEVPSADLKQALAIQIHKKNSTQNLEKQCQTEMAARAFFESFERLYVCYAEVGEAEWQMSRLSELHKLRGARSTHETQRAFVSRSEILAQQLYATTASLIKLLSHIRDHTFLDGMPSRNVSDFLNFLDEKFGGQSKEIGTILKITHDYRGKYIDHPNQLAAYNWYTANIVQKTRIVYYSQVGTISQVDISEQLRSPIPHHTLFQVSQVFVPPHHTEGMQAFGVVLCKICKSCEWIH